jgi:hypothetical protein
MKMTLIQKMALAARASEQLRGVVDKLSTHVHDVESETGIVIVKLHPSDAMSLAALTEAGLR